MAAKQKPVNAQPTKPATMSYAALAEIERAEVAQLVAGWNARPGPRVEPPPPPPPLKRLLITDVDGRVTEFTPDPDFGGVTLVAEHMTAATAPNTEIAGRFPVQSIKSVRFVDIKEDV